MSAVGLVLGGGGITGAAFEIASLMALELATGWSPHDAEVIVGTSSGAFVASLARHGRLDLDALVLPTDEREAVARRIRERVYLNRPGVHPTTWLRHGLLAGLRNPGLTMLLGSPARYDTAGIADWVREQVGEDSDGWPDRPTVVVAYDVAAKRRIAFGTVGAPEAGLAEAVAASSAIPVLFRPCRIDDRLYVDGGIVSGTNADLVLGSEAPLDLVLALAPMASELERRGAWFHERMFDRVGRKYLEEEVAMIRSAWPHCEVVVITPTAATLAAMRPNPMEAEAAVPTFVRALRGMKRVLTHPDVWRPIERHLKGVPAPR
jgi:NTE family protein